MDISEFAEMKIKGEVLPYERLLIPQYEKIRASHQEALLDSGGILNKELSFIGGIELRK